MRAATLALIVALWGPAIPTSEVAEEVTVEYVAHACFRVRSSGGSELLLDPYADRVWLGYDFPRPAAADAILISHPHYDHDGGRYRGLEVPWAPGARLLDASGEYTVGDMQVTGVAGKHADPYGKEFGQRNTIWLVQVDGIRIVHVGDNGPLTEANVRALGRVDVLMLPIDADYHILSQSQIDGIVAALRPRVLVPMHYRLPDLEAEPDSPSDLGEIDSWLAGRQDVIRVGSHRRSFSTDDLPAEPAVWVFDHGPAVVAR